MKRINRIFPGLLLLPLLPLFFPLAHGGGPFPSTSFQILAVWSGVVFLGSIQLLRPSSLDSKAVPVMSAHLLAIGGVIGVLAVWHGQYDNPIVWVAPGLLALVSVSLPVFLSFRHRLSAPLISGSFVATVDSGFLLVATGLSAMHLVDVHRSFFDSAGLSGLIDTVPFAGFYQQNLFTTFLVSVIGFSIYNRVIDSSLPRVGWMLPVGFLIAVVLSIESKVGWLSLFLILCFWFVISFRAPFRWIRTDLFLAVSLGAAFAYLLVLLAEVKSISEGIAYSLSGEDGGISIRLTALKAAWLLGFESPWVGHGFGAFQLRYPDAFVTYPDQFVGEVYRGVLRHPHNEVAYWWVSGGIIGLVGVVGYSIWLVISASGGWQGFRNILLFAPLAIHCMVELPLYQSAAHWYLLSLFLVWPSLVATQSSLRDLKFSISYARFGACALIILTSLSVLIVSIESSMVAASRFDSRAQLENGSGRLDEYIEMRANHSELEHWAYRLHDGLFYDRHVFQLAMKEGNGQLVMELLPLMKQTMRHLNDQRSWSLYAGALAGLGKKAELIGFIDYIEKLDPKYASGMRQAYGL